jgi:hypothetical protein
MSLFNFNPNGFLGSGAFTLDPSKFNFSNISYSAPEPVDDPVDVVSDKTPTPEVEVLEGAGTVAVTKTPEVKYSQAVQDAIAPDPIEQAIQSVIPQVSTPTTPIDLGMNFGLGDTQVSTDNLMSQGGISAVGGFDITESAADQLQEEVKTQGELVGEAEQQAFGDFTFNIVQNSDLAGQDKQLFSSDERSTAFETASNNFTEAKQKLEDAYIAQGLDPNSITDSQVLAGLGLSDTMYSDDPDDNMELLWQWDSESQEYKKIDNRYDEWKDTAVNVAVGLGMAAMTGGVAGAAGAITGTAGSAVATGVTNAAVNAGIQQTLTGDVDWGQAAVAGVGAGVEVANANAVQAVQAAEQAAEAATVIGATQESIQIASDLAQVAQEATAVADVANTIQTTVDIVKAVDSKDILEAVDLGLSLAGSSTVSNIVSENLTNAGVPTDYIDVATSTVITAADTAIKGGDVGDVVQESINNILIETVATEDNIRQTFNLSTEGFDETLTKTLSSLTKEALEGGNREEILGKGLEAFVKNLPESDTESPDYLKQVEEWWHENIEDPFESWWQEIEPQREVIEQAMQSTVDTVKDVTQKAVDVVDEAVRALPPTKEDLEQLVADVKENVVDPAVGVVRETGRAVEEGYDVVEDFVKEDVAPVVREVGRDIREVVPEVEESGVETADVDLPSVDVDMPALSADPELTRRNMSYFYDDSSLLRNPLLRSSDMTVQDLTRLLQQEEAVIKAQAEEEERIKRSKPVYGFNPNISVG